MKTRCFLGVALGLSALLAPGCIPAGAAIAGSGSGGGNAPAPPAGLIAEARSGSVVVLRWADRSTNESGFRIERRTATTAFETIATVPAETTEYVDTGREPFTTYSYRARSFSGDANSEYSNVATVTTPAPAPTVTGLRPDCGSVDGGETVTITGSGFSDYAAGMNTVAFGGVPAASVTVTTDSVLTCVTPRIFADDASDKEVQLTNSNGVATVADAFTYFAWPPAFPDTNARLDDPRVTGSSSAPQTRCDGRSVYVVWQDDRNGTEDIYLNASADSGETWLPTDRRVDTDGSGAASTAPQFCVDGSNVYVVWQDNRLRAKDLYFNRSTDRGATWLTSDLPIDSELGDADSITPRICCAGNNVYIVWQDDRNGRGDIYFDRSTDGGLTWQAKDVRLDADAAGAASSEAPQICCEGARIYVVWQDDRASGGNYGIYFNQSTDGGATWSSSDVRIDDGTGSSTQPQIGCAGGNVHAVWKTTRAGQPGSEINFGSLRGGSARWSTPVRINRTSWTDLRPAVGPSIRQGHAMATDRDRRRVVMFGGFGEDSLPLADTWEWDGETWEERKPRTSPPPRALSAMAYDENSRRTVLFGGGGGGGGNPIPLNDTWEWDGSDWRLLAPSSPPSARYAHAMVYDEFRQLVVLFGGKTNAAVFGDTKEWDGIRKSWNDRTSLDKNPPPRSSHAMAYDSARHRLVLFGGKDGSGLLLRDTWERDDASQPNWADVARSGPSARASHAMAYDALGSAGVLLFGGGDPMAEGDTWAWDGSSWLQQQPVPSPGARQFHAMAYDRNGGRILLFGGLGSVGFADTWGWASGNRSVLSEVPQICCDGDNVYVVWRDQDGGENHIYCNRSTNGGTSWLPRARQLDSDDPNSLSDRPRICCAGRSVHVVWQDHGGVYFNASRDGGDSWQNLALQLDAAATGLASVPQICCDRGRLHVVWQDGDSAPAIYSTHRIPK